MQAGGGLYSTAADISISNSSFTGNQAAEAGGIGTDLGSLTLTDSTVDGNMTTGSGGGIGGDGFVTISGGSVSNNTVSVGDGGGISSGGTLVASGTIVSGNSARSGGGIDEAGATTLTNLTISENDATAGGGAIRSRGSLTLSGGALTNNTAVFGGGLSIGVTGVVSLTATTISGNRAQRDGGGIINLGGILTVLATQIDENVALELGGGGIVNREGGVATISDSTISDNVGGLDAGGIFNGIDAASLTLLRSTVSGNQAGLGGGGAILNVDGALNVTNSTISGNSAVGPGGGVLIRGDGSLDALNATITQNSTLNAFSAGVEVEGGSARLQNSLVAANSPADCAGPVDSLGHNLDSDDTCQLDGMNDLPGRDAQLGAVAENGGPTPTQALLPNSPAIDAALDIIAPAVDQRGFGRLGQADIGAFEFQDDAAPAQLVLNLSLGWESVVYTGSNGMLASELADLIGPALTIMLRFDAGQGIWLTFRPDAPIPQLNTLSALNQGDALFLRLNGPATLTLPDLLLAGATSTELRPGFTFVGFTGADTTELADLLALLPAITGAFVWGQPAQAWLAFRPGQPIFLSGVTSVDRLTGIFLFNASAFAQTLTWNQVAAP